MHDSDASRPTPSDPTAYGRLGRTFGRGDRLPIDPDLAPDDPSAPARTHRPATVGIHRRDPRVLGWIALGGFAGTLVRYGLTQAFPTPLGGFPWTTFTINTSGAFLLGFILTVILERWHHAPIYVRSLTCVGFIGAWTTMSTFALESDVLVKDGHVAIAVAYVVATLVSGVTATALGLAIGRPSEDQQ
ncbi:MAG: fluoride efflux transporter FluC [Acidimicrobiales bacterium]